MKNAISWFEIPTTQLDSAQAFYESVLGSAMRREAMGPSQGAVFAYDIDGDGVGGALMMGPTAPAKAAGGALVYLDASPSLDVALERVVAAGGQGQNIQAVFVGPKEVGADARHGTVLDLVGGQRCFTCRH